MIIKVTISRNKLFCKSVYVVAYDEKRREKLTRGERMALIEIETATLGSLLVDAYICIRRANGSKKRKGKKKSLSNSRAGIVYISSSGRNPSCIKKNRDRRSTNRNRDRVPLADRSISINGNKTIIREDRVWTEQNDNERFLSVADF